MQVETNFSKIRVFIKTGLPFLKAEESHSFMMVHKNSHRLHGACFRELFITRHLGSDFMVSFIRLHHRSAGFIHVCQEINHRYTTYSTSSSS